jgi:hypothetical protein
MKIWLGASPRAGWCWCHTAAEASREVERAIAAASLVAVHLDASGASVACEIECARYAGRLAGWFRGSLESDDPHVRAILRRAS